MLIILNRTLFMDILKCCTFLLDDFKLHELSMLLNGLLIILFSVRAMSLYEFHIKPTSECVD